MDKKCKNINCNNKVKGGHKWNHNFCLKCRQNKKPLVTPCEWCGNLINLVKKPGQVPKVCSLDCRAKRKSLINSVKYKLKNKKKHIRCDLCNKVYNKKNVEHKGKLKYCSKKCYDKKEFMRIKLMRIYKKRLKISKQTIHLII